MPGPNCAFPECIISRTAKYQGIGIFQIPVRDNDFHVSWRNNIVKVLGWYRVMDKTVRERNLLEIFTYVNDILKLEIWNLQVRKSLKIYFFIMILTR